MSSVAADETSEITGNLSDKPKVGTPGSDNEEDVDDEEGEIYEVERILKDKLKRGTRVYLVRWKGYGAEEDSWEPEDNLEGARDILNAYLASLEKKKSVRSNTKDVSGGGRKSSGTKRASSRTTYKEQSDDDGDEGAKSDGNESENDFGPNKKKGRKSESSVKSKKTTNGTPVDTPSSNVDKVVARRKNLSKNMRWITESSDDSDGGGKSDGDDEEVESKKSPGSSLAIHPDSSTDVGQKLNGTSTSSANGTNSLKLKITKDGGVVNGGRDSAPSTPNVKPSTTQASGKTSGAVEQDKHSSKEKNTGKKSRRVEKEKEADDVIPPNANTKSTLTFTGVYRENKGGELRYIAIDDKTKKREIYVLGDAFIADGWSLCRFLSSKVKFSPDGGVVVAGEDGPSGSNGN